MARFYGKVEMLNNVDVTSGVTVTTPALDIGAFADLLFTWAMRTPAAGTFSLFGSPLDPRDDRMSVLNPSTNPFWAPFGTSVITAPDGVAVSGAGNIGDNAIRALLVQYTAIDDTTGLTLIVGTKER